jgi:hypothetical protein
MSITSKCECEKKACIKAKLRIMANKYEAYQNVSVPKLRKSSDYC